MINLLILFFALGISTALAGVNFAGLGNDASMLTPPDFKSTEEALAYGEDHRDNIQAIAGLGYYHSKYDEEVHALFVKYRKDKDDVTLQAISDLSAKSQLLREALEMANGIDNGYGSVVGFSSIPIKKEK